ncbi:MAG TPA: lipopolysaccharide assembly protein LapB [Casimicrobiaceae bacterium]|nr:lipopolysaccharide assembly protein LapB [Casimicrobiaceae bacterium]
MDFEPWWLLPIPVLFFALGWVAARIDIKHLLTESRALPLSYFRGLNFLLNEQPDKAIESFIEVVKVDPQTIDLHFALGSLFRRQGEIDRAIRMHQNLLDRPDLPRDRRETATFELAQDFHRAGLLDRAEDLFMKLDGTPYEHASQGFLLAIYETEKDWPKAIAITRRMEAVSKTPHYKEIAHYHCELAQAALVKSEFAMTRNEIDLALAEYRACARATMIAGDAQAQQGHDAEAIGTWLRIESQNPAFLALVAERVGQAYARNGDAGLGIRVLANWQANYPSPDVMNALFALTLAQEGSQAAAQLVKTELAKSPTLLGLDRLLEAQLKDAAPERRYDLELVKGLVGQHIKRLGMYRCEQCGFRARQYYWRCPGCQKWETYSPKRTEALEYG